MLSVYSCGCSARNVPPVSRCLEHNGHVVVSMDRDVPRHRRASKKSKDGRLLLLYDSLQGGMSRLKDNSVGLVLSYPDHFPFAARESVFGSAFLSFPDPYFTECRRLLRDDGHIVLVVEHSVLSAVLYSAAMSGFRINSVSWVRMEIKDLPSGQDFLNANSVYKFCVVLAPDTSKSRMTLGSGTVRDGTFIAEKFHTDGFILDTSCIHYPFVLASKKVSKTVGIVSGRYRYRSIVERINK